MRNQNVTILKLKFIEFKLEFVLNLSLNSKGLLYEKWNVVCVTAKVDYFGELTLPYVRVDSYYR